MKRVYIVVEGQTEQEFVNEVLFPYLHGFGIFSVTPLLIKTSRIGRGGFVNYDHMRNTIKPLLGSTQNDFIVTTLVDFFRMPSNIPNYAECIALPNKHDQIDALEQAINTSINDNRFFAYIQMHEFETLLFANNRGFDRYYDSAVVDGIDSIIQQYSNPEDINSTPQGAPSNRILSLHKAYDKINDGNIIALEVGISEMLNKCPRFRSWVDKIINEAQ